MTRYERVIQILDASIGGPAVEIGVHKAFWRGLTRDQFVAKRVRNLDLVTVGDGNGSNIVKALRGESPFGADLPDPQAGARFSRMPAGLAPVSAADIEFIRRWIDEGCLEDPVPPTALDAGAGLAWRPTNAPVASSRTDDIWFITPEIGWAVNSNGQIIHTTDGGDTWNVQLQANVYFRCIGMANEHRGWAGTLTLPQRLFHTRDGGQHWELVTDLPVLAPSAICGMSVVDEQVVYASGTNFPNRPARVMKTTDGGATWVAWEMKSWADLLVDCYFTSPTTGWVVGGKAPAGSPTRANVKPVVLYTDDGGSTWENRVADLDFPAGEWGWKIFFLNEAIGFVSLENFQEGAILKTLDGGRTWVRLPINDLQKNANLEGVGFIDEHTGWVGGWGDADFERKGSSVSIDGGATWSDANEIGHAINRFRFFGNPVTVGYASGETVYKMETALAAAFVSRTSEPLGSSGRTTPIRITRAMTPAGVPLSTGDAPADSPIRLTVFGRFGNALAVIEDVAADGQTLMWQPQDEALATSPGGFIVRVENDADVFSYRLRVILDNAATAIKVSESPSDKTALAMPAPNSYAGEFRRLQWEPLDAQARVKLAALAPPDLPEDPFLRAFLKSGINPPTVPGANSAEEEFAVLLMAAAEIEHALMVQYLYAWFTSQDDVFLTIAIQEMGHLFSVQNLLRCHGYKPHLQLPDPSTPSAEETFPFPLYLGTASIKTLAQYVIAESPLADTLAEPLRTLVLMAEQDAMIQVRHVGILFLKLYWMAQPSKSRFGPWGPALVEAWEEVLGPRHLAIGNLAAENQRSWNSKWDVSLDSATYLDDSAGKDIFVGRLNGTVLSHAEQVCRLFYAISLQGEGYENDPNTQSHFERFVELYDTWKKNGLPAGISHSVPNPWIGPPSDNQEQESNRITDPDAVVLAHAFNLRYERVLLLIALTFTDQVNTQDLLEFIRKQAVGSEMRNLSTLAAKLLERPAKANGVPSDPKAGPPFRTLPIPLDYTEIRARLVELKQETDGVPWPAGVASINTVRIDQALLDRLPV